MTDNIHKGHRERQRKRYMEHGLDNFDDHSVLELLLTFAIPRRDVNGLAHTLIGRFGGLSGVFEAPPEELMLVDGIGENAAVLLKLLIDVNRRYLLSKAQSRGSAVLREAKDSGEFFVPYFYGEGDEMVYAAYLDDRFRLLACRLMFRGGLNSAGISIRKIVEAAIANRAVNVILAHNHPDGIAIPSIEDRQSTQIIARALKAVEITLLDHIIVAGEEYLSMEECGYFAAIQ